MDRSRLIVDLERRLDRHGYPRLEMGLIVALTGGVGFLSSNALLHFGLHTMWLRYLAALGVAYGAFLGLLGLWLRYRGSERELEIPDLGDAIVSDLSDPGNCSVPGRRRLIRWRGRELVVRRVRAAGCTDFTRFQRRQTRSRPGRREGQCRRCRQDGWLRVGSR